MVTISLLPVFLPLRCFWKPYPTRLERGLGWSCKAPLRSLSRRPSHPSNCWIQPDLEVKPGPCCSNSPHPTHTSRPPCAHLHSALSRAQGSHQDSLSHTPTLPHLSTPIRHLAGSWLLEWGALRQHPGVSREQSWPPDQQLGACVLSALPAPHCTTQDKCPHPKASDSPL